MGDSLDNLDTWLRGQVKRNKWKGLDTVPYRDGFLSWIMPRPGPRACKQDFSQYTLDEFAEEPRSLREFLSKPIDRGTSDWTSISLFHMRILFWLSSIICILWVPFVDWLFSKLSQVAIPVGCLHLTRLVDFASAPWLPDRVAVFFEETTTVFKKYQVMRATISFTVLGSSFMALLISFCVVALRRTYDDESCSGSHPFLFDLGTHTCTFLRELIWTAGQYERKLVIRQGLEAPYQRAVRELAWSLLSALEPVLPGEDSKWRSADLRWAQAEMLRKGTLAELDFIFSTLDEIVNDKVPEAVPHFERWHQLQQAALARALMLSQKVEDGAWLVTGRRRQSLQKLRQRIDAQMDALRKLAPVPASSTDAAIVQALVKLRRPSRRSSPPARQTSRGAAREEGARRRQAPAARRAVASDASPGASDSPPAPPSEPLGSSSARVWNPDRCFARVREDGCSVQCRRRQAPESDLCPDHELEEARVGFLIHGRVNEDLPSELPDLGAVQADGAARADPPQEEADEASECVCCFEEEAVYVFQGCGHLIYCETCVEWASSERTSRQVKRQNLFGRVPLRCPLCRGESQPVHRDRFEGKIYSS